MTRLTTRALAAAIVVLAIAAATAAATITVPAFNLVPSTTQAGGHPDLVLDTTYATPDGDTVRNAIDSLAPGFQLDPAAAPTCADANLANNTCPAASTVGADLVDGKLNGGDTHTQGTVHLMAPASGDQVARLGIVTLVAGNVLTTRAAVVQRADGGLDIRYTDIPKTAFGFSVQIVHVRLTLNGTVGGKPFVTSPATCTPATNRVTAESWNAPGATVSADSAFTPTGCSAGTSTPAATGMLALAGLASKAPKLTLTVTGTALTLLDVKLPAGLSLNKAKLAKGLSVMADGKVVSGAKATGAGSLRATLAGAHKVVLTVKGPALKVSGKLAAKVRKHKAGKLTASVKATAGGKTTTLKLTASAR
jgi:hypothetical protein